MTEKRQAIERKVIRHLIRTAKAHGYALTKVFDGEESVKCQTETDAMDTVFSVDESTIYFKHPDELNVKCAVIVLGNDGWDAISDCSVGERWNKVMDECTEYANKGELA
jgi:hypothetical protein